MTLLGVPLLERLKVIGHEPDQNQHRHPIRTDIRTINIDIQTMNINISTMRIDIQPIEIDLQLIDMDIPPNNVELGLPSQGSENFSDQAPMRSSGHPFGIHCEGT